MSFTVSASDSLSTDAPYPAATGQTEVPNETEPAAEAGTTQ